jgi:ribosomal protein L11 methyltransferase
MNSETPIAAETQLAVLETDEQSARRVADLFAESFAPDEIAVSLVDTGQGAESGQNRWRVTVFFRERPEDAVLRELAGVAAGPEAAKALRLETIAAKDWVRESLAGLKSVPAGRFLVHGAHDRDALPPNRIGIEIEAALAFGTGHHGTTRGCLLALEGVCKLSVPRHPEVRAERASKDVGRGARAVALRGPPCGHLRVTGKYILDIGTGTGVLSIAAARALRQRVLATDIDAPSVRVARDNARLNRAGAAITFLHANGVTAPAIHTRAPFDLVFANILLGPLKRLATPVRRVLAPGGRIVLSGILNAQANAVLAAYRPLRLERRIALDGWTTLVLRRGTRRRRIARRHHQT